jgi:hypothetical protein
LFIILFRWLGPSGSRCQAKLNRQMRPRQGPIGKRLKLSGSRAGPSQAALSEKINGNCGKKVSVVPIRIC